MLNARITYRADSQENWNAIGDSYIPLQGELVFSYQENEKPFLSIGDGETPLAELKTAYGAITDEVIDAICI